MAKKKPEPKWTDRRSPEGIERNRQRAAAHVRAMRRLREEYQERYQQLLAEERAKETT